MQLFPKLHEEYYTLQRVKTVTQCLGVIADWLEAERGGRGLGGVLIFNRGFSLC